MDILRISKTAEAIQNKYSNWLIQCFFDHGLYETSCHGYKLPTDLSQLSLSYKTKILQNQSLIEICVTICTKCRPFKVEVIVHAQNRGSSFCVRKIELSGISPFYFEPNDKYVENHSEGCVVSMHTAPSTIFKGARYQDYWVIIN